MSGRGRRVRPRGAWAGTGLALVGTVLLGLGVGLGSWAWTIPGLVVLAAGALVAYRSGALYDAHTVSATGAELAEVAHDETRRGVVPGQMIQSPEIRRSAHETDLEVRRRIAATEQAPRPVLSVLAGWVVLLVAVFLILAQWMLYPMGDEPQRNATRSLGAAIVLTFCAVRVLTAPGRHPVSGGVTLAVGALMLLAGLLTAHATTATAVAEVVCGAFALLAGATFAAPGNDR